MTANDITGETTPLHISAWDLDGYNPAQRECIESHRGEYSDQDAFVDLTADYAEELHALA